MRTAQGERRNSTMQANNNPFTLAMSTALARAPRSWHRVPADVRMATIRALQDRGLVEVVRTTWLAEHYFLWRIMRPA